VKFRLLTGLLAAASALGQSYSTHGDEQLAEYIARAVDRNPAVRESFARYRAALQKAPQAGALPDPMLEVTQYARTPESRVGPQTTALSVQQRFPWFGKRSDRRNAAAKDAEALAQVYEAQKAETVRRVKLAYYDLAYVDRAIVITEEDLDLLRHYETLAQARYAQGVGLQQAPVKLQAEITRALNRLETLRRQRIDAEAVLNTLMDLPANEPLPRAALPGLPQVEIELETLYARARNRRPEIHAALLKAEAEEKRIHLARREGKPDVTVGAGFTNVLGRRDPAGRLMPPPDDGKDIYRVTVGVNLPIFRRKYKAGVLEATEHFLASKENYREAVNDAELSVRSAGFRIETIRRQLGLFQDALLPQAEQALRSIETAYSTGEAGVLDLLDSERTLLDVRLGLAQLRSDYMKSLAEMERAIGSAFPEVQP